MAALRSIAHSTRCGVLTIISIAILTQVVRVWHLQDLEKQEWIVVRDLNMLVVRYFPLHGGDVVLIPVHQPLSDLLFLVDLWQGHLAAQAALPSLICLDLLKPLNIVLEMKRQLVPSKRRFRSSSLAVVFPILLLNEVPPQVLVRRVLPQEGQKLLLGHIV